MFFGILILPVQEDEEACEEWREVEEIPIYSFVCCLQQLLDDLIRLRTHEMCLRRNNLGSLTTNFFCCGGRFAFIDLKKYKMTDERRHIIIT